MAGAVVALAGTAAFAGASASDGGNTVTVSVASSVPVPGSVAAGPFHQAAAGASNPYCTSTGLSSAGTWIDAPSGANAGSLYLIACPGWGAGFHGTGLLWVPTGSPAPAAAAAASDPSGLAIRAERAVRLPSPVISTNPAPFSITMLPTWLWIEPSIWHQFSATVSAGSVTATATATPQSVRWDMGDGSTVTCIGPGTPFQANLPAAAQQTTCSHTYLRSSAGQASADGNPNDGAYTVTATITWAVSWTASIPQSGGALPPLVTHAQTPLRVEQVQSVDTLR